MRKLPWPRFGKFLLRAALTLCIVLGGAGLFVRYQYPSERLRQILITTLAEKYQLHAEIAELSFNLFTGFTLSNLTLAATASPEIPAEYQTALRIAEMRLSYRWRSLFARRLDIDAVTILQPQLAYWQNAEHATNLEALLDALSDTTHAPADTVTSALPIAINLNALALRDLHVRAAFATAADTQFIALGPMTFALNELAIDRSGNYRGTYELRAAPAHVAFHLRANDSSRNLNYEAQLEALATGSATIDSIVASASVSLHKSIASWGNAAAQSLPALRFESEAQYSFAAGRLVIPHAVLFLDEKEILAARYEQHQQNDSTLFAFHIARGHLDLAEVSRLTQTLGAAALPALHDRAATGTLDFSNSDVRQTPQGLRYALNLRGTDICYNDARLGLRLDTSDVQVTLRNLEAASAARTTFTCSFEFQRFAFPREQLTLHTGPGSLRASGELAQDFSLEKLQWELAWHNLASERLESQGNFVRTTHNTPFQFDAKLRVKNLDLAPFTADTLQGRVSGELALTGTHWDNLQLACALQHGALRYRLEADTMHIAPFNWTLNAKLKLAPDFSDWQFNLGTLQGEPATANFTARYQTTPGVFRFDLNNATVKLDYVLGILPRSYFEGLNPKLAGASSATGWINFNFTSLGAMEYQGKLLVNSDKAWFTDDSLGIYADWLELQSQWNLATKKTTGDFTLNLRAARMPDYIRIPLPLTIATGKIEIDDEEFVIKEGNFGAPAWHLTGDYRVTGKFLQSGMHVQTRVNAALESNEWVTLDRNLTLQGKLAGHMLLEQEFPDDRTKPQPSHLELTVRTEHVHARMDTMLALHDLNADLNFAQAFDFRTLQLSSPQTAAPAARVNANEALLLYDILGNAPHAPAPANSHLRLARLQFRDYEFADLAADLHMGEGRFDIPQLRMNFLGGNVLGNLLVGYGDGNLSELTYSTALQVSSIDVSRLRRIASQVEKGAQLSADFYLTGKGAESRKLEETLSNLVGKLNITKIEKKTATNLLTALDPNGTDAGIQRMRLLLKTGWNVKYMTFEMKNGFIYASLAPIKTKPWSALFNLPTTLDFARLPVKYFISED